MSLQVKFPFGRGHGPLHTCGNCGFMTRHRAMYDRHLKRCGIVKTQPSTSERRPSTTPSPPLPSPPVCRNYRCEKCGFTTSRSKVYLHHRRESHGENFSIYPCDQCEYASRHKSKVIRHRGLVHKDAPEDPDFPQEMDSVSDPGIAGEGVDDASGLGQSVFPEMREIGSAVYQAGYNMAENEDGDDHDDDDDEDEDMMIPDENQNTPTKKRRIHVERNNDDATTNKNYISTFSSPEDTDSSPTATRIPDPTENPYDYITSRLDDTCSVSYRCRLCIYSNIHKWKVATHVRSVHMRKTLFKCPLCEFVTERKIEWCVHKTTHTEKLVHSCKECSYRTTMKRNFERHLAHHRMQGGFKCNKCSYSTSGEAAVQRHMAEYHPSPDKQLAMDTIHYSPTSTARRVPASIPARPSQPTASGSSLIRQRTNTMARLPDSAIAGAEVQCHMCRVWFKNETRLRIHMVAHSSDAPHGCPVCNLRYKRPADLNRHMKRKHGTRIDDGRPVLSTPEQDQPLDLCVKKSDDEEEDEEEVESEGGTCSGDQPLDLSLKLPAELNTWRPHELKCSHCSYMAKWPSDLRRHMLVHSIEKRFRCPQCNKKYKYQFDLNMHMRKTHRIQTGKTRVSSAAAFSAPPSNKITIKQETPETIDEDIKPTVNRSPPKESQLLISTYYSDSAIKDSLKCPHCEYVGKYPAEVERHTKLHTGPKPYLCLFCEYRSYWKSDIKRHLIKHHGTEVEKYGELPELVNLCYKPEENSDGEENFEDDEDAMEEKDGENGADDKMEINADTDQPPVAAISDMSEYSVEIGDKKVYQCPKCPLQYDFPSKLKNHLEVHDNIKKFLCPHCRKRSNWQWDIRKHIINVHPDMSTEVFILTESEARETIDDYLRTRQPSPPKTTVEAQSVKEPETSEDLGNVQGLDDYARVMNIDSIESDEQLEDTLTKKPHSLLDSIPGGVDSLNLKGNSVNALIATVAGTGRYRKFKCSKCGKRSNWRWDIKKHIRSNHVSATVLELSEEEAKETFHEILTVKPKEAQAPQVPVVAEASQPNSAMSTAGRKPGPLSPARSKYRPFKCTFCGKRSNWKWDLKKHLMKCDQKAQMIILSEEVARATFDEECKIVPNNTRKSLPEAVTPAKTSPPEEIPNESPSPKVKKFKCSICPYRSDYRSDISRHLKRKHRRIRGKILVLGTDYAASTLMEYKERWVKKKFVISPEKFSALQEEQEINGIPELDQCVRVVDVDPDSDDEFDQSNVGEEERAHSSPEPTEFFSPAATPSSLDLSLSHNKLWQCTKCEFRSRNKMTVIDHFRSHRQGRPFKCNVCQYTSDYRGSIYRHVKQKHKRKDYQDVITYVALKEVPMDSKHTTPRLTPSSKEEENRNVDPKFLVKTFQCQLCPSKTIHKHNLIRHIKEKHPEIDNPHQCFDEVMVYGGKTSNGSSKIKTNAPLRLDGARTLRCDLCPFQTVKSGLLKIHQQYHIPKSGDHLRCKYCPYYVCTMQRLLRHMRLHVKEQNSGDVFDFEEESHAQIASTPSQTTLRSPGKARHFCDKCPYISINKNDFIYHKQFHRPKPTAPYKCDFCPYWVSLRRLLTQHQKVHSVEYKLQYYPKDVLMKDKSINLSEVTQPSPTKSEMSIYSVNANDVVEVAQLKQQIISSKVTSVPITPQKLRTSNLMDVTDDNLMKGYIVDSTGHIMGNKSYQKLHQCQFCPYQNVRSTNLRLHERMHGRARHDDKELFRCQYCDYQVGNKGLLAQHVIVHSSRYQPGISEVNDVEAMNEDGDFLLKKSSVDGDEEEDEDQKNNNVAHVFPQRATIKADPRQIDVTLLPGSSDFYIKYDELSGKPILEKAVLKKWGCDRCPYATMKKVQFERHVMLHGCKQRYQCEFCDYSVPGYHLLLQHKKLHLMPNPNLLNVQSISNLQRLPEIPADFAAAANVPKNGEIHKYGVHDSLPMFENSNDFAEPKKLYRCDRCPYTNIRRDHLLSHLKFHMINSDLRCPYCDYSVSKVHLLNQHVKVHFTTPGTEMSSKRKEEEKTETPDFFTALKLKQKVRTEPEITIESIERDARENMAMETDEPSAGEKATMKGADSKKKQAEKSRTGTPTDPQPNANQNPVQEQALSLTMTSPRVDSVNQSPSHNDRDDGVDYDDYEMPNLLVIDTVETNATSQEQRMEVDDDAKDSRNEFQTKDRSKDSAHNEAQDLSQKTSPYPDISVDYHPKTVHSTPTPTMRDDDAYPRGSPARAHTDSPRRSSKLVEFRCRYCDRVFPSMHKMLLHEEQHLLGGRY